MSDSTQQDRDPATDDRDADFRAQVSGLARTLTQTVVVTGERVQETIEDAVRRGRMTRKDAHELAAAIVAAGRRQTDELRGELEQLLDRGRGRRVPIADYDDLTAVQVTARLEGLSAADLAAVRAHEERHRGRKTVLRAVDRRLSA